MDASRRPPMARGRCTPSVDVWMSVALPFAFAPSMQRAVVGMQEGLERLKAGKEADMTISGSDL
jgi:hypothetical protein